jgi:hypothetical protein
MSRKRGRKSRFDVLKGIDIGGPKKPLETPLKSHEIPYKSFKTALSKEYANYAVIGRIQPYFNIFLKEWEAFSEQRKILPKSYPFFKDSAPFAVIRARSFEEVFHIYYKRAILPFSGGIGNIREFLPKKKFLMNKNTYYNGTIFIQRLKANPNEKEFKIALIDATFLFLDFDGSPMATNHPLHPKAIAARNIKPKKKHNEKEEE